MHITIDSHESEESNQNHLSCEAILDEDRANAEVFDLMLLEVQDLMRRGNGTAIKNMNLSKNLMDHISSIYEPATVFLSAIVFADMEIIRYFLNEKNANINQVDRHGRTALMLAAYGNVKAHQSSLLNFLLQHKDIDINLVDHEGSSALMYFCRTGNVDAVKQLLKQNDIDKNYIDPNSQTALSIAVNQGYVDIVKILLEDQQILKASRTYKNQDGATLAMQAALFAHTNVLELLIAHSTHEDLIQLKAMAAQNCYQPHIARMINSHVEPDILSSFVTSLTNYFFATTASCFSAYRSPEQVDCYKHYTEEASPMLLSFSQNTPRSDSSSPIDHPNFEKDRLNRFV